MGDEGKEITWQELANLVKELGRGLMASGVKPGDRVGIIGPNSPQWIAADLAILSIGAETIPTTTPTLTIDVSDSTSDREDLISWKKLIDRKEKASSQQFFEQLEEIGTPEYQTKYLIESEQLARRLKLTPEDLLFSFLPLSEPMERIGFYATMFVGNRVVYVKEPKIENLPRYHPTITIWSRKLFQTIHDEIRGTYLKRSRMVRYFFDRATEKDAATRIGWIDRNIHKKIRTELGGNLRAVVRAESVDHSLLSFFHRVGVSLVDPVREIPINN